MKRTGYQTGGQLASTRLTKFGSLPGAPPCDASSFLYPFVMFFRRFHVDIFLNGGVAPEKIHIVPEAVDTALFDPERMTPLDAMTSDTSFKFLSVFKWEARKGWDVLLRAYFTEFTGRDNVSLYIRTYAYHSASNFEEMIAEFAAEELGKKVVKSPSSRILFPSQEPLSKSTRVPDTSQTVPLPPNSVPRCRTCRGWRFSAPRCRCLTCLGCTRAPTVSCCPREERYQHL